MKSLKKLLPGLLCALAICVCLPFRAEAAVYGNSCGTNADWILNTNTGVLTISGTGAVTEHPWCGTYPNYAGYINEVVVQSGITSLPGQAFRECRNLTKVTVADTVTTLGWGVFHSCDSLTDVTLPTNLTAIPDYAFYYCSGLTELTIPDKVASIGEYAFLTCIKLESVTLPDSVKTVGTYAFPDCRKLTSIDLGSVESLGDYAINACTSLTQVTLPATLTDLGKHNFIGCDKLTAITVEEGNPVFSADDGILYSKDGKTLVYYPDGKEGTEFTLPETVTAIGYEAFYSNCNLTALTLHSGIQTVGASAAYSAEKLTDVYYDGTQEKWSAVAVGDRAFDDGVTVHFGLACKTAGTQLVGYAEATCTENGYTGDTVCTGCGAVVTKGKTVTSSGHSKVWHSSKSPTCTSVGWDGYYTCKNCDYTEYKEQPMLDHSITHTLQAATCTEPGQEYWQCSSCKQYFTDADGTEVGEITVLPSPGHSWSAWSTVTAATWLEAGAESRSCTACGETETKVLPATGQTVVDGITVTVTEGGLTLKNVPQGLTVMLGAYSDGRQVSVQLGTTAFTLPGEGYSFLLFFVDSAWRPIGTAKPIE